MLKLRFISAFGLPASLALLAGCAGIAAPRLLANDASVKPADNPDPDKADPYVTFNRKLKAAQAASAASAARADFLREGIGLVDYRCGGYFESLGLAEQQLGYDRKQTSLTSGVVLSLAGLAKATTRSVSTAGALFSFASASMDSYEDAYLFSPDVKLVQDLVIDSMHTYQEEFSKRLAADPDIPMPAIWATLAQYEALCQPANIKHLVNQSVKQATTAAASAPAAAASTSAPAAAAVASAAASAATSAASATQMAASAAADAKAAKAKAATAALAAKSAALAAKTATASASAASSPDAVAKANANARATLAKAVDAAKAASSSELAASQASATARQATDLATTLSAAASAAQSAASASSAMRSAIWVQPRIVIDVVPKPSSSR